MPRRPKQLSFYPAAVEGPKPRRRRDEQDFLGLVMDVLKFRGWLAFHDYDSRKNPPGFPDIVAVKGRCLAFLELKVGDYGLSPAQVDWRDRLQSVGTRRVLALVTRPETLDDDLLRLEKCSRGD